MAEGYLPIADHGLIGDLRTCALVGADATIDWFCAGRFDSPSVFGSLLDPERGGSWRLGPVGGAARTTQFYLPDSAILVTRFLTEEGVTEVHDFMPVLRSHDPDHRQRITRRVVAVRGHARIRMELAARPDYGRCDPTTEPVEGGVLVTGAGVRLGLTSTVDLDTTDGTVSAEVALDTGDEALFVLHVLGEDEDLRPDDCADTDRLFDQTARFWRDWLAQSTYAGRWREMVDRSAITLKLLTHEPSGAIIAAPTTSLPEEVGGGRNWDYRYVWIRDAAFSLYALLRLGFTDEAGAFIEWLSERIGSPETTDDDLGPLRVLYDIDGNLPHETELDHLRGYADSLPVRVGNGAVDQLQLDIYGELIDSVYLFNKYGPGISHDAWADLTRLLEWVLDNWEREDAGMWEIRDDPRAHTTSRLMCWVAIERMMRTARQRGLPGELARWAEVRDAIYARIMEHSWDDSVGAFMQHEGADTVDAGVLLMPMVKFVAPNDPRFVSTLQVVEERLVSDSLVFRYDLGHATDGLDGTEGTFSLCSFWYVEALTRLGRLDDARLALEKMFTYANHLGLYGEQVGLTGEQLGNFPQAFTHLGLISAALNLDRALG
ncbi:glycoside hydrolase family 15 protein [Nocardioides lianchengensis]|uniref:Glucoamylase (Glucan-1,4-alpha-glucosidase), GH15 family n=1 Tax=Nocardioides lianchengensis TaxID=1045774 RepID=A0A1G6ILU0_9ACTN|nr:glycoside hydrolase family 15 protein [Nocardioides lianchengensis]NYG13005.1 GH15 family glucan-1,4-alpha-glucosidase [Nocardioides lianchengensis]SDC07413.1 Glucoamylase (glucan-1,4-alpha-glucosidase), GH15 family [Nocardioides lianchengensis]